MTNRTYDVLKVIFSSMPLVASFVLLLRDAWGIPYAEPIAITIGGLSTLGLGILAEVSKEFFKNKEIVEADKQEIE